MIPQISIKRIFSTLDLPDNEVGRDVAIEWALHCIDSIGSNAVYNQELVIMKVEEFSLMLPNEAKDILYMNLFPYDTELESCNALCEAFEGDPSDIMNYDNLIKINNQTVKGNYTAWQSVNDNTAGIVRPTLHALNVLPHCSDEPLSDNCPRFYKIFGRIVRFNFKEGIIAMVYECRPQDEEGFPMIPDIPEVIDMINAYIEFKWLKRRAMSSTQGAGSMYADARRRYETIAMKARGAVNLHSMDYRNAITEQRKHIRLAEQPHVFNR